MWFQEQEGEAAAGGADSVATTDLAAGSLGDSGATGTTGASEASSAAHRWLDGMFAERVEDPLLQALILVALAFVLAKLLDLFLCSFLKVWAKRTKLLIDDQLISLLHGPIVKTCVLAGLGLAVARFELEPRVLVVTTRSLLTIALLVWGGFAFRAAKLTLTAARDTEQRFMAIEERTFPLFDNLAKLLLFGLFSYALISLWQIPITGWLASAGIMGIAVGFAAQDTLSNLFAGIFIIADAPYKTGDFITLESGERGRVAHIGLRSTRIVTRDDIEITVPNSTMGSASITNETGGPSPKHRVRIELGVAYGTDVDRLRAVLMEIAADEGNVCADPEPRVRFRRFGESALEFQLLCWIPEPVLRGRVVDALNTAIYKRLATENIEIPFPKRDLYVRSMPESTEGTPLS